jgi:hypothetical protein
VVSIPWVSGDVKLNSLSRLTRAHLLSFFVALVKPLGTSVCSAQTVSLAQRGPPGVPGVFKGRAVVGLGDCVMFFCGVCGYKTANISHVKRHYLRHTGEKFFACPYCGFATFRKDYLKKHVEKHCVRARC